MNTSILRHLITVYWMKQGSALGALAQQSRQVMEEGHVNKLVSPFMSEKQIFLGYLSATSTDISMAALC